MSKFGAPPAMNAACAEADMPAVVAAMPATLICAVGVKTTPAPFEMMTWPFELSVPAMRLASGERTRLKLIEDAPGWLMRVVSPCLIEKLFQLMTDRSLAWLTVTVFPLVLIVALPPTTWPPAGLASAPPALPSATAAAAEESAVEPSRSRARTRRGAAASAPTVLRGFCGRRTTLCGECARLPGVIESSWASGRRKNSLRHV